MIYSFQLTLTLFFGNFAHTVVVDITFLWFIIYWIDNFMKSRFVDDNSVGNITYLWNMFGVISPSFNLTLKNPKYAFPQVFILFWVTFKVSHLQINRSKQESKTPKSS